MKIKRLVLCLLTAVCVIGLGGQGLAYDPLVKRTPFYNPDAETCAGSESCVCGAGSIILPGSNNAEKIWNFFAGKKDAAGEPAYKPEHIAGIMGNMRAESNLEPRLVQYGKLNSRGEISVAGEPSSLDDTPPQGSDTGYGIVQFTPATKILPAATRLGLPPGDLGFQLTLIDEQLNGKSEIQEKAAGDHLRATRSVEEASKSFEYEYERHANNPDQEAIRIGFAQEFMLLYGSGTGVETQPTGGGEGCAVELDESSCPINPVDASSVGEAAGIRVHACIAEEVERIIALAQAEGLNMSGWGWRTVARQEELRAAHGCGGSRLYDRSCRGSPPTAVPGRSRHERGSAVDFTCDGVTFETHTHPCFIFLRENTSLINLPSEAWHWSIDGG